MIVTGVLVPFMGQNWLIGNAYLRVLKSKMATVRIIVVPVRVLSSKNMTEYNNLKLVEVKIYFEPCLSNRILVPFSVFLKISNEHPHQFCIGVPPLPP